MAPKVQVVFEGDSRRAVAAEEQLRRQLGQLREAGEGAAKGLSDIDRAQTRVAAASARAAKATSEHERSVASLTKHVLALGAAYVGAHGALEVMEESIRLAEEQQVAQARVNVLFAQSADVIDKWAKTTASSIFTWSGSAETLAANTGKMLEAFGKTPAEAAKMSTALVDVAAKMAFVRGLDTPQLLRQFLVGMSGRTMGLRRLGIAVDDTRLAAEALRLGLLKLSVDQGKVALASDRVAVAQAKLNDATAKYGPDSTQAHTAAEQLTVAHEELTKALAGQVPKLTTAQKGAATYSIIMRDSRGDVEAFARAHESGAGQIAEFHALVKQTKEEIGVGLLPVLRDGLRPLNAWLANEENQERIQRAVKEAVAKTTEVVREAWPVIQQIAEKANEAARAVGGWKNVLLALVGIKFAGWAADLLSPIAKLIGAASGGGLLGAEGAAAGLLARMRGLASLGAIGVGITMTFKARGDKGVQGVIESIFGNVATGAGIGGLRGGLPGALVGGAAGLAVSAYQIGHMLGERLNAGLNDGANDPNGWRNIEQHLEQHAAAAVAAAAKTGGLTRGETLAVPKGGPSVMPTAGHATTHPTEGLPGFPAFDYMAQPGTRVLAPENGRIVAISGHDPSTGTHGPSGDVFGWSLYYVGEETGATYYMTHLFRVAPLGRYAKGDTIAVIGSWPGDPARSHVHVGVHRGPISVVQLPAGDRSGGAASAGFYGTSSIRGAPTAGDKPSAAAATAAAAPPPVSPQATLTVGRRAREAGKHVASTSVVEFIRGYREASDKLLRDQARQGAGAESAQLADLLSMQRLLEQALKRKGKAKLTPAQRTAVLQELKDVTSQISDIVKSEKQRLADALASAAELDQASKQRAQQRLQQLLAEIAAMNKRVEERARQLATARAEQAKGRKMLDILLGLDPSTSIQVVNEFGQTVTQTVGPIIARIRMLMQRIQAAINQGRPALAATLTTKLAQAIQAGVPFVEAAGQKAADALATAIDNARSKAQSAVDRFMGLVDEAFDRRTEQLVNQVRARVSVLGEVFEIGVGEQTPAEKELADWQRAQQQKQLLQAKADAEARVAAAQTDQEREQAERDLQDAIDAIYEEGLQERAEAERQAADKAIEEHQQQVRDERALQKQALDDQLNDIIQKWQDQKITETQARKEISAALKAAGLDDATTAAVFSQAMQTAFVAAMNDMVDAINRLIAALQAARGETRGLGRDAEEAAGSVAELSAFRSHGGASGQVPYGPVPTGYASGGRVVAGSGNRDTVPALLTPGEIVFNVSQQRSITDLLRYLIRHTSGTAYLKAVSLASSLGIRPGGIRPGGGAGGAPPIDRGGAGSSTLPPPGYGIDVFNQILQPGPAAAEPGTDVASNLPDWWALPVTPSVWRGLKKLPSMSSTGGKMLLRGRLTDINEAAATHPWNTLERSQQLADQVWEWFDALPDGPEKEAILALQHTAPEKFWPAVLAAWWAQEAQSIGYLPGQPIGLPPSLPLPSALSGEGGSGMAAGGIVGRVLRLATGGVVGGAPRWIGPWQRPPDLGIGGATSGPVLITGGANTDLLPYYGSAPSASGSLRWLGSPGGQQRLPASGVIGGGSSSGRGRGIRPVISQDRITYIVVQGNTILGRSPETAEDIARAIKPALERRIIGFTRSTYL